MLACFSGPHRLHPENLQKFDYFHQTLHNVSDRRLDLLSGYLTWLSNVHRTLVNWTTEKFREIVLISSEENFC